MFRVIGFSHLGQSTCSNVFIFFLGTSSTGTGSGFKSSTIIFDGFLFGFAFGFISSISSTGSTGSTGSFTLGFLLGLGLSSIGSASTGSAVISFLDGFLFGFGLTSSSSTGSAYNALLIFENVSLELKSTNIPSDSDIYI